MRDTISASSTRSAAKRSHATRKWSGPSSRFSRHRELAAADTSRIAHLAERLGGARATGGCTSCTATASRRSRPTTCKRVAAKYLQRTTARSACSFRRKRPSASPFPRARCASALVSDYKGREALAAGEAFDATPAEHRVAREAAGAAEGIKVRCLPKKTRGEEVQLSLTLRYGNEKNLKDLQDSGRDSCRDLMLRGTKKLSYQQLRDELDRLNATLDRRVVAADGRGGGIGAGSAGAVTFSIQAKRDTLAGGARILQAGASRADAAGRRVRVLKRERLAVAGANARPSRACWPADLLSRQLGPVFQGRHPLRADDRGVDRAAQGRDARAGARLYREFLGAQAGELAIVGDFDAEACLPILQETLSGWTAANRYARIATPVPDGLAAAQHKLEYARQGQRHLCRGLVVPLRDDDPDYPALVIANYILGGGALSSRLGDRVRQKEGLSYGDQLGARTSRRSTSARACRSTRSATRRISSA